MKIELRAVSKSYRSIRALDRVSLEFEPGQIITLLGPNGAGKTTLLRCLAGIAAPDQGAVYFDNEEFHFANQSVLRNIAIVMHLFDADARGSEQRVLDLLREFDLLPLALRPLFSLSRGQAYKAALISMLAIDREVWLLDEPFASGMDPNGIDAFKQHARAAAARGRTILYSTQLLDVAGRFSDRVCVIHKGEIRAFDTLDRLRERAQDKDNVLEEMFRQLRETQP
jgi:ABC-type multidrug transport system ATPase subunit